MATLNKTYPSVMDARRAVEALRVAGLPGHDIRLLTGAPLRDIRHEPVGGFAGPVAPDDPVGTYGGGVRLRRQGTGAFAGDPDQQRQGSFGDVDRVTIATYDNGSERRRFTGRRGARRLLQRTTPLEADAIERVLHELEGGHAVVLVDVPDIVPSAARAPLEQLAQAA